VPGRWAIGLLIRRNRDRFLPILEQIPILLGANACKATELMSFFVASSAEKVVPCMQDSLPKANLPTTHLLGQCRRALHRDRRKSGDFEICVAGQPPRRVHCIVMYAAWPYFRRMFDSNLNERHQRRLNLPAFGSDGGIQPALLTLIIEVAYVQEVTRKERVGVDLALHILSLADLYFRTPGGVTETERSVYDCLIEFAMWRACDDVESCVDVLKSAIDSGLVEVSDRAKNTVKRNLKKLLDDRRTNQVLRSLPSSVLVDIMSSLV
jgi:hypothetical protein